MFTSHMGERLRWAREAREIGVRELARRLGVGASWVTRVESGQQRSIRSETLVAWCRELGVSMD